jgi:hypothetical protein
VCPWLSDALCRLASGGSFAVRQLYTNDEEVLFKAAHPLNGIEDVIGRPDLADRAIFLTLGTIGEEQRRSESELWREFDAARPRILGALLDAAAHGLAALGCVHLHRLPRMADFELWAAACETGLWPAGTFSRAYAGNRKTAVEGIIDADPIATCVRQLMSESATLGRAVLPIFCGSILLQKSQIAWRQFSCCNKIVRRSMWPQSRYRRQRVYLQAMRSPTYLHESRVYSQKKF